MRDPLTSCDSEIKIYQLCQRKYLSSEMKLRSRDLGEQGDGWSRISERIFEREEKIRAKKRLREMVSGELRGEHKEENIHNDLQEENA
jgi:hypothetical protein